MPELPEVETTRRGIEPHVVGRRISRLIVHERRLRWPVDLTMPGVSAGSAIRRAGRRAKYLLLETEAGHPDPAPRHVRVIASPAGGDAAHRA